MKPTIFTILFSLIISTQAHAWIFKLDAEGGTLGQRADGSAGFIYAGTDCTFDNSEKHSGNKSFRCRLPKGSHGESSKWSLAQSLPSHVSAGGEIWFRTWVKLPANYQWSPDRPGNKFMRLHTYKGDGTNKQYIDAYSKTNGILVENWAAGVNNFYQTLGVKLGSPVINNSPKLGYRSDGAYIGWEAVEIYIKVGPAGQGIFRSWRNGIPWFEDMKNATAQDSGGYIKGVNLFGHYSNTSNEAGSPQDQSIWVDDIIITNERPSNTDSKGHPYIGVGDIKGVGDGKIISPPNPPLVQ